MLATAQPLLDELRVEMGEDETEEAKEAAAPAERPRREGGPQEGREGQFGQRRLDQLLQGLLRAAVQERPVGGRRRLVWDARARNTLEMGPRMPSEMPSLSQMAAQITTPMVDTG